MRGNGKLNTYTIGIGGRAARGQSDSDVLAIHFSCCSRSDNEQLEGHGNQSKRTGAHHLRSLFPFTLSGPGPVAR
jgi:hypothetical protein